ncbi:MAG: CPBP family intramembrane glutamic endopeptidase [Cyanobacteriota bacterium]
MLDFFLEENQSEKIKTFYIIFLYISIISNIYLVDSTNFKLIFSEKNKLPNFFKSWLYGFSILSFYFFINIILGFISINSNLDYIFLFETSYKFIFISLFVGIIEELLFRNFIFNNISKDTSFFKADLISAYIYAQAHFFNFSLGLKNIILPFIGIFILGRLLNKFYQKEGLFFSIGFHSSLVFIISVVNITNFFKIKEDYLFLSGGNSPLSGLLGVLFVFILLQLVKSKK